MHIFKGARSLNKKWNKIGKNGIFVAKDWTPTYGQNSECQKCNSPDLLYTADVLPRREPQH